MNTAIKAAGGSVPAYYTQLFEKIAALRPVTEMLRMLVRLGLVLLLLLVVPHLLLLQAVTHPLPRKRARPMMMTLPLQVAASSAMMVMTIKLHQQPQQIPLFSKNKPSQQCF